MKINQKYGKENEKTRRQQKEARTEMYIKGSRNDSTF